MKKFGKFEKRPEAAQKKEPNVKSALLQTYMVSLLCLVLCVTMFFGTSYAWFTSEVTNEGNEIYIGTLDVGLFKQNGEDLSDNDNKLFDGSIRWEPGFTALETIKVVNEGDLAFKYVLSFVDGKAVKVKSNEDVTATISDIAKYFDVWVYDHYHNKNKTNVTPNPGSYEAITAENSGWTSVGTLEDVLNGNVVLEGKMLTVRGAVDTTAANAGTTDGVATEDTYTIALHMREDATSEVMGHKISLNAKLIAYQLASEKDSMGQTGYDHLVTTEADLKEAFEAGGNVTLLGNVTMTEGVTVPAGKVVNLDLNGYALRGNCKASQGYLIMVNNGATLNVSDGSSAKTGRITYAKGTSDTGWAIDLEGKLNLYSGTIELTGQNWNIGYAVDVRPNAWGTNYTEGTVFHMYGGKVISSDGAIRVASSSSDAYGNIVASFIMDGGEIEAEWDGIFIQQSNAAYDTLNVTINGGKITSAALAPIRFYAPVATSVNAGTEKPMTLTISGGELSVNGTPDASRTWYVYGKIVIAGGISETDLEKYTKITLPATP